MTSDFAAVAKITSPRGFWSVCIKQIKHFKKPFLKNKIYSCLIDEVPSILDSKKKGSGQLEEVIILGVFASDEEARSYVKERRRMVVPPRASLMSCDDTPASEALLQEETKAGSKRSQSKKTSVLATKTSEQRALLQYKQDNHGTLFGSNNISDDESSSENSGQIKSLCLQGMLQKPTGTTKLQPPEANKEGKADGELADKFKKIEKMADIEQLKIKTKKPVKVEKKKRKLPLHQGSCLSSERTLPEKTPQTMDENELKRRRRLSSDQKRGSPPPPVSFREESSNDPNDDMAISIDLTAGVKSSPDLNDEVESSPDLNDEVMENFHPNSSLPPMLARSSTSSERRSVPSCSFKPTTGRHIAKVQEPDGVFDVYDQMHGYILRLEKENADLKQRNKEFEFENQRLRKLNLSYQENLVPQLNELVNRINGEDGAWELTKKNQISKALKDLWQEFDNEEGVKMVKIGHEKCISSESLSHILNKAPNPSLFTRHFAEKILGAEVLIAGTLSGKKGTQKYSEDKVLLIKENLKTYLLLHGVDSRVRINPGHPQPYLETEVNVELANFPYYLHSAKSDLQKNLKKNK